MSFPRTAGILLHPTSLPGTGGIGDLGPDAHRFVKWLSEAGIKVWQMLPLGPTGYGNSPYQCFSAFAGNPMLIHVPDFAVPHPSHRVDFGALIPIKRRALNQWLDSMPFNDEMEMFVDANHDWLPDYAQFMATKRSNNDKLWTEWKEATVETPREATERVRGRTKEAQNEEQSKEQSETNMSGAVERTFKEQFVFYSQFDALKKECQRLGISLMGDVPIYVAHDSSDVWSARELFSLNEDGSLIVQAGVPPDYFSTTGQLWGNPIYDWDKMKASDFSWWKKRIRHALSYFDIIRLDHFRGFEAYWEVAGDADTAEHGQWKPGPGAELFEALERELGLLPVIAEDLGLITPQVEALRDQFAFPGMSILQFAFSDPASIYLPHRLVRNKVIYTGTHDNDTTHGWWNSLPPDSKERAFAMRYLVSGGEPIHWMLIRTALASVADTALIPMQDVLGLGSEARMNLPGRASGNWEFRFSWDQVTGSVTKKLKSLIETYGR